MDLHRLVEVVVKPLKKIAQPGRLRPTLPTAALPLFVLAIAFTLFGVALILQPERWDRTPSYGNLLDIAPQWAWGIAHLAAAVTMFASIRWRNIRRIAVVAHSIGLTLVGSWLLAFVVRYLTDGGTTVVNVVSWSVYLYLLLQSLIQLDQWTYPRPSGGPKL